MNRPTKKLKILVAMIIITIAALVEYFVILPESMATRYIERVHQSGNSLREGYFKLEETTGQALIDDPAVTSVSVVPQIEVLLNSLREDRVMLSRFAAEANDYHPLPYTGWTTQARAANALQNRSATFTAQIKDAFVKYEDLILFIKRYDATSSIIEQHVEAFNATLDLNVYAGRADEVYAISEQIHAAIKTFDTDATPYEAREFKTASVQAFTQIADGFDTVALGLQIPADDVIYGGAQQIDAVDQTINGPNQEIYRRDILSSRTIKSIQEIREKLDLILPS
jgi:hypothetical protein